ncbi:MAG: hypothetical protein KDD60_03945, partial [Bdellovibrionales bacterium]|nr:hypothetical protein [Bdellovibrionales bacterium]
SEWKYQLINPNISPIGLLLYGEATVQSDEVEIEEKIVISSIIEKWVLAANIIFEQAWEFEHGSTGKESKLGLTLGASYQFANQWAAGLELFNERAYEGLDFDTFEEQAWFLGPNIHYGAPDWWVTFTVAPQIPLEDDRNLEQFERVQARLIVGVNF